MTEQATDMTGVGQDADRGIWMQTWSGGRFYPIQPRVTEVHLSDIAWGLAHTCRFAGQCERFYSVAQHSLIMCDYAQVRYGPRIALYALMHDASEAYIGDMIRPLKVMMPDFQMIERRVWSVIAARFDLGPRIPPEIKALDNRILAAEKAAFMPRSEVWPGMPPPLPGGLGPLSEINPETAAEVFMDRFRLLRANT